MRVYIIFNKITYFSISLLLFLFLSQNNFAQKITLTNPNITNKAIIFYYHNNYANTIYLKTSFDNWKLKYPFKKTYKNPLINSLKRINTELWEGWWKLELPINYKIFQLKKGRHTYKLLVDNEFITDPNNPNSLDDEMGNLISYFEIEQDIVNYNVLTNPNKVKDEKNNFRFIFKNFHAKQIYIVSNFNHWNSYSHPLTYIGDGIWEIKIKLPPGKYYYNFIVGDKWTKDPLNTRIEKNVIGKTYSVFEVKE